MRFAPRYHHHAHWLGIAPIVPLLWLIVIGLCVWLVYRVWRSKSFQPVYSAPGSAVRETPEEVLDRRFAAGEIDADAHAAARQHLKDHPR